MKYGSKKHLDYIKHRLQQTCRTPGPVTVMYVEGLNGFAKLLGIPSIRHAKRAGLTVNYPGNDRTYIFIEKNMGFEIKAQTLVHEWAHTMTSWRAQDHGISWVKNYTKAYKKIFLS
jgi:hypothetical protein